MSNLKSAIADVRRRIARILTPVLLAGLVANVCAPLQGQTPALDETSAGQGVRLYYFREATKIAAILNAIAAQKDPESVLKGLITTNPSEDEIVLYGTQNQRNYARRIIAALDLPRPGITM